MIKESVISATEVQKGVFIASTLVQPENGKIPIRLLSTTENDITIHSFDLIVHNANDYIFCHLRKHVKMGSSKAIIFAGEGE